MDIKEIKGRAVHESGLLRVDNRPATDPKWRYQALKLMNPDDEPEWVPVPEHKTRNWPKKGWNSIEDW